MINVEFSLVKAFGWSLADIDQTSIESLIPFVLQVSSGGSSDAGRKYCDEVDWL